MDDSNRKQEIAKFLCGAEAFHAFIHMVLWLSGTTFTVFGITVTPAWNMFDVLVNAVIALFLGKYAWGRRGRRST